MKPFTLAMLLISTAAVVRAQVPANVVSPEVLPDHRVTFRLSATNATKVTLFGDWMQASEVQAMTRDDQGVWTATAGPFPPGLAIYTFTVDGVTTPDPVNPRIKLRARTSASMVYVPGDPPALWEARGVPHGTVAVNWEKSEIIGDTRAYYVYTPPGYEANPFQALSNFVSASRQQRHGGRLDRCGQGEFHFGQLDRGKQSRADDHRDAVGPRGSLRRPAIEKQRGLRELSAEGSHAAGRKKISRGERPRKQGHRRPLNGRRTGAGNRVWPSRPVQRGGRIQFRRGVRFREPFQSRAG